MRERPILMSAPMVRALLNGTKTQTRRVVRWPETFSGSFDHLRQDAVEYFNAGLLPLRLRCPYGAPGDVLWVREAWCHTGTGVWTISDARNAYDGQVIYRADGERDGVKWWPSIHMPRWASRITLRITDVRVERLQDIGEADARAEGCPFDHEGNQYEPPAADPWQGYGRASFSLLWSKINGGASWDANPWVWVVAFERVEVAHG